MGSNFSVGYLNFAVLIMLLSGLFVLLIEMRGYELSNLVKEKKTARFLGWLNIVLGALLFMGNWLYLNWPW